MFYPRRFFLTAVTLGAIASPTIAAATPTVDFVPQRLNFQKGLDDDVSGAMSQHVSLTIKNVGNTASRYPGAFMRVLLNGKVINADVYGTNGVGGFNLDAPIAPGQTGLVLFTLPLNTLSHCRLVKVQIDADRRYQYGGNVFGNDTAMLYSVDTTSIRACVAPIIRGNQVSPEAEADAAAAEGDAAL